MIFKAYSILLSFVVATKELAIVVVNYFTFKIDAPFGSNIYLPVTLRGRGKIKLEKGSFIDNHTKFFISKGAEIILYEYAKIHSGNFITATNHAKLVIKKNASIGEGCRLIVEKDWVLGPNSEIKSRCFVFSREKGEYGGFYLGKGSQIGDGCVIDLSADFFIGNFTSLGTNCTVYTHNHGYLDKEKISWIGNVKIGKITIEESVWVGSNVTILPGVRIGKHSVIGAGSVITKDVESFSVYAGVPAKKIRSIE